MLAASRFAPWDESALRGKFVVIGGRVQTGALAGGEPTRILVWNSQDEVQASGRTQSEKVRG